jgi:hypothetical protein
MELMFFFLNPHTRSVLFPYSITGRDCVMFKGCGVESEWNCSRQDLMTISSKQNTGTLGSNNARRFSRSTLHRVISYVTSIIIFLTLRNENWHNDLHVVCLSVYPHY